MKRDAESEFAAASGPEAGKLTIGTNTEVKFATANQAREFITRQDDYTGHLSPLERSAKSRRYSEAIEPAEHFSLLEQTVLDWGAGEKVRIENAVRRFHRLTAPMGLNFPEEVYFVKTNGMDEGQAAYTRENAIFLPPNKIYTSQEDLDRLVFHESFHVLTRNNPDMRERLYNCIGFEKCNEPDLPDELKGYGITNPDAPKNDHCIKVGYEGKEYPAMPIVYLSPERYDPVKGGSFFDYIEYCIMLLEEDGKGSLTPAYGDNGQALLANPDDISGFYEQIGYNTGYVTHPEEILAENFVFMVCDDKDLPSPEIVGKMRNIIEGKDQSPEPGNRDKVNPAPEP